ncbi:MAG: Crp/Fnr family transcriptional regulator [Ideonella sp.]|nr:Crp/Fnr family transcriptional regulator [Ideonella sp.]
MTTPPLQHPADWLVALGCPVRWTAAQRATVQCLVPLKTVAKGRLVFAQGGAVQALYGVHSGLLAARFQGVDGQTSVLAQLPAGELFGLAAFSTACPSSYEAQALRPTKLWVFGPEAYAWLMDDVPGFARWLMTEFARRFDGNLQLLQAARHRSALERVGTVLQAAVLAQAAGHDEPDGVLRLNITQAQIAEQAGLSRQTVSAVLAQLEQAGKVRRAYGALRWWP